MNKTTVRFVELTEEQAKDLVDFGFQVEQVVGRLYEVSVTLVV